MNREFLFRIWEFDKNEFYYPLAGLHASYCVNDNYLVQQYTGLKDKNNKKIFEGDIVRLTRHDSFPKFNEGIVFYWEEKGKFALKSLYQVSEESKKFFSEMFAIFDDNSVVIDLDYWTEREIIGNECETEYEYTQMANTRRKTEPTIDIGTGSVETA